MDVYHSVYIHSYEIFEGSNTKNGYVAFLILIIRVKLLHF
jgi:hypothetical protein